LHPTLRGLYDYVLTCITHRPWKSDERMKQYSSGMGKDGLHLISEVRRDTRYSPSTQSPNFIGKPYSQKDPFISKDRTSPTIPHLQLDPGRSVSPCTIPSSPQIQPTVSNTDEPSKEEEEKDEGAFTTAPTTMAFRERLGGYLHPRDMRRLVTPFISSNEPALIVRRHVMLLNFDPLRTIVLRDRLLVLVPDGADSILLDLERRVKGTMNDVTAHVFEDMKHESLMEAKQQTSAWTEDETEHTQNICDTKTVPTIEERGSDESNSFVHHDEWENIDGRHFIDMPFELQAVDAVLATVCAMLSEETGLLKEKMMGIVEEFRGDSSTTPGDNLQEQLRALKNSINEMEGRVQGVVRALNLILDEDEDMALMNLSRLMSHPERFLQPVSQDILNEESDEPELILEAYLQQALCESNALELLKGNISSTESLVNVKLDAIRNRLLYINTMIAVFTLSVTVETVVGSFYGTNLDNHLLESPTAWWNVTMWTAVVCAVIVIIFTWILYRIGVTPNIGGKGYRPKL